MWQPSENNPSETLDPPDDDLMVGGTYTCSLTCPDGEFDRTYQLRVMDNADYESKDEGRRRAKLILVPATKGASKELSGSFTVDPAWAGKTIRIGFIDADPDPAKAPFGLGGTVAHAVP